MAAGVVKNIFLTETQNRIHDVYTSKGHWG